MADKDNHRRRKRARIACTVCNARRVKCNVSESQPCNNCVAANAICETRESRRGKHPRTPRPSQNVASRRTSTVDGIGNQVNYPNASSTLTTCTPRRHEDEVAASHVLASLSSKFPGSAGVIQTLPVDSSLSKPNAPPLTPSSERPSAVPSSDVVRQEDDAAVYLGESSSLRYVTDEQAATIPAPNRPKLRHSVPNAVKADAIIPQWESERREARMKALTADGAFSFPPEAVRVDLLKAYFRWFHPHFAIVDEPELWKTHREGNISPLLLQAMLFIGVIHCEGSTLDNLGWGNRHRAKWVFYTRAKDIYDAEFETKKLTVTQALFLMSFWRAGALLEKDARHWLGAAISLAQTKALHRSAGEVDTHCAKLKRRLWWAIYVRERQCGSALGLPNRIRDKDCDVELLTDSDFISAFEPTTPVVDVKRYTAYTIGIMQLAVFMGKIVDTGYLPNRTLTSIDRSTIREEMFKWKQQLPASMDLAPYTGEQPSFQASMLHLAYNNLLILLHRSSFIANGDKGGISDDADGNIALNAAARNSRILEDLLPTGNIGHAQMHVITNLFNTLCIHVVHLRRSSGIHRTLAEHRAKLCLLGLQELQRTWDVTNWLLQLFFQYLDRSTAARLAMEADDVEILNTGGQNTTSNNTLINPVPQGLPNNFPEAVKSEESLPEPGNMDGDTTKPWSWTTDEANQYLFSQIENDFAFGEGGMLDWSPAETLGEAIPGFGYAGLDSIA